jgi:hypothetical protein
LETLFDFLSLFQKQNYKQDLIPQIILLIFLFRLQISNKSLFNIFF